MICLYDLLHASDRPSPPEGCTSVAPLENARREAWFEYAQQQARFIDRSSAEITTLIVPASLGFADLDFLLECHPGLRQLWIVEAKAGECAAHVARPPEFFGGVTARQCWFLDAACLEPVGDVAVYLRLAASCVEQAVDLRTTLYLPETDPLQPVEAFGAVTVLDDLLSGFGGRSVQVIADMASQGTLPKAALATLRPWMSLLAGQGQWLHALQCHLVVYELEPAPIIARDIAALWHELQCFGRALEWLEHGELEAPEYQQTHAALSGEHEAERQQRAEMAGVNAAHIKRVAPALSEALQATPAASLDVVWLRDYPWVLELRKQDTLVEREDYPVLVQVEGPCLRPLNLPGHPRQIDRAIRGVPNKARAHACVGEAIAIDALLNIMRNPVTWTAPNWRQAVYVVQEQLDVFQRFLQVCDYRQLFDSERVLLSFGAGAEAQLIAVFEREEKRCLPTICAALSGSLRAGLQGIESSRLKSVHGAVQCIWARHNEARLRRTLEKFERGEPLNVWAQGSLQSTVLHTVMADLVAAMRQLGHNVEYLIESGPHDYVPNLIAPSAARADPDFLVMVDHLRVEAARVFPPTLPCLSLILDELPHLRAKEHISKLSKFDLCFPWSKALARSLHDSGYPHAVRLPFSVNPSRYRDDVVEPAIDRVAFATHLRLPDELKRFPGFVAKICEIYAALPEVPRGSTAVEPCVDQALDSLGAVATEGELRRLRYDALLLTRVMDRRRIADAMIAANIPVSLYGGGWAEIPEYAPYAKGVIEPGLELQRMYQSHKVVLHVNQDCSLHPRVLEAMVCGGFVLARSDGEHAGYRTGDTVNNFFDIERELCLFADNEDMVAKIHRAFSDETWRQTFITAGRARVLRDHCSHHRAEQMLAELHEQLRAGLQLSGSQELAEAG